ncbi:glucan biosynthesis protein D [Polymorphum gilvum SL003B-26A1]|uniref:Glucan biosynthesis protein D n=1 Tax=Polymorphum gilvum (strain LMG 25793 / CGMCC 1.9160 / SL003B-26A1) TaxID=991905 RepID=F2J0D5_POLGS|nr:glucan biosynthesis protein D [Polymorphum gilvum SL003B-26A1]
MPASHAGELATVRGAPEPFGFELLVDKARALAAKAYAEPRVRAAETLEKIDYDAHWKIRFRPEETVMIGETAPVQFFHTGRYFKTPVRLYQVEGGQAREILYNPRYFEMPEDSPARDLPADIGFAGFRVMRGDLKTDWISFLGASYFRTDGQSRQYGQSARGLALDTGLSRPEEFPRFTDFWLAGPEKDGDTLTIYALLDSPSVAGAYKMSLRNADGEGQVIGINSRLFFRAPVERLGIAPLTSMYWYSETNRSVGLDWRPEVHDTDGLAIVTAEGERIWRPLNNPEALRTSTFLASNLKGFGLAKRDREFENYQDDGVFYDRRPSVWIEPLEPFGEGAVQLVEIPTDDEIFDNIVAYFLPKDLPEAGSEKRFHYRMHWTDRHPVETGGALTVATRVGQGGVPGQPRPADQIKVVIDFKGPALDGLTRDDGVVPVVELSRGEPINPYLLPVVGTDRWRLVFDARVADHDPIEARAYLKTDTDVLTETWLGQISHELVATPPR